MREPNLLPLTPADGLHLAGPAQPNLYLALADKERDNLTLQSTLAAQEHLAQMWRQRLDRLAHQELALRGEIAARALTEQALHAEIAGRVQTEQALRAEIAALTSGASWRLVQALRRWRHTLAPAGTIPDRLLGLARRAWRVWRQEGFVAVSGKTARFVLRKLVGTAKALVGWHKEGRVPHVPNSVSTPAPAAIPPAPGTPPPAPTAAAPLPGEHEQTATGEPLAAVSPPIVKVDLELLHEILACSPPPAKWCAKPVDVIVPVYKGLNETLLCLRSLLTSPSNAGHEIIVINDASVDLLLVGCLRKIAARGLITLLDNGTNLGFVQTVNRGLALHPDRDVILLNSDTEVYGDWIDRLNRAAYSAKDVGTVTPFSNSATICSYPNFCQDNPIPADLSAEQLDRLCAQYNPGQYIDVPTGVGFCMYLRRDCLNQVGFLDAERFGKGYGEENDFCMRARARSWRHLLACDTFVRHVGGTSFGATKSPAIERALTILESLHPDYLWLVAAHVIANPARFYRRRLDLARLAGSQPAILYVTHHLGGGTERHVVDMAQRLEAEGVPVVILRTAGGRQVRIERLAVGETPNLVFTLPEEYWTLREALRDLGVEHVHVHHTIGMPKQVFDLIRDLGLPYDWTVHDYYPICPRINLIDGAGTYCGEPGPVKCNACLASNGAYGVERAEIVSWREESRVLLAGARKVIVPHPDVAARLTRYFPDITFTVRRHFETHPAARPVAALLTPGEPLRIAVIGVLAPHKGQDVVRNCAAHAWEHGLPLRFHIVGSAEQQHLFQDLPNVSITGPYREEEVFNLLASQRCHCAFFPAVWPETYSYTLSIALLGGLYALGFDLGAHGARIRESGLGHVIPLTTDAAVINHELLRIAARLTEPLAEPQPEWVSYPEMLTDYYDLDWGRVRAA